MNDETFDSPDTDPHPEWLSADFSNWPIMSINEHEQRFNEAMNRVKTLLNDISENQRRLQDLLQERNTRSPLKSVLASLSGKSSQERQRVDEILSTNQEYSAEIIVCNSVALTATQELLRALQDSVHSATDNIETLREQVQEISLRLTNYIDTNNIYIDGLNKIQLRQNDYDNRIVWLENGPLVKLRMFLFRKST